MLRSNYIIEDDMDLEYSCNPRCLQKVGNEPHDMELGYCMGRRCDDMKINIRKIQKCGICST